MKKIESDFDHQVLYQAKLSNLHKYFKPMYDTMRAKLRGFSIFMEDAEYDKYALKLKQRLIEDL
jgi:hypothetical protein